jgi:hypothetical protein
MTSLGPAPAASIAPLSSSDPLARRVVRIACALGALIAAGLAHAAWAGVVRADIVTGDNVLINFHASIEPRVLPRGVPAPVSLHVDGIARPLRDGTTPAGLSRVVVQVNRHALFTTRGLPSCPPARLNGTRTREALAACRGALIGTGFLTSHIDYPEQAPFPTRGRILVFNSKKHGHSALAVHVYGRRPASTSTVLSGALVPRGRPTGPFGPRIVIEMPKAREGWGYVNGFGITFHRRYRYRGLRRSLISANCPAPEGFSEVPFRSARGTFEFSDGQVLTRALGGNCRAGR